MEETIVRQFKIPIAIYDCEVNIIVSRSIPDTMLEIGIDPKHVAVLAHADYQAITFQNPNNSDQHYMMFHENTVTLDNIVHECDHIVSRVLDSRGIRLSHETEEVFAYFDEFLFKTIRRELKSLIRN